MLGTLIVWRALSGDKQGLMLFGVVILAIAVGTVVWNVSSIAIQRTAAI